MKAFNGMSKQICAQQAVAKAFNGLFERPRSEKIATIISGSMAQDWITRTV